MPLTTAYPAAVLPLARTPLVFSALVTGSMAPDFPYFVSLSAHIRYGHTPEGIVLFCVPAGLAALWVFHSYIGPWLYRRIPERHRIAWDAAGEFRFGPANRLCLIVLSVAIGAITHVAWDSCTHGYGWTVERVAFLRIELFDSPFGTFKVYRVLQHGCSVLGMAALACYYLRWVAMRSEDSADR